MRRHNHWFWICLILILIFAVLLRSRSFDWGLPSDSFHLTMEEDERIFMHMVSHMDLPRLDMNPNFHAHAPMVAYLWEIALTVSEAVGFSSHKIDDFHFAEDPHDYRNMILAGRAAMMVVAMIYLLLTALLFRKKLGDGPSLLATAFLAVAWEPVNHSHQIRHDLPSALLLLLVIRQAHYLMSKGRDRDYLLMGLWLGIGCSILYVPSLWLGGPLFLTAHLIFLHRSGKLKLRHVFGAPVWKTAAVTVGTFILLVPWVIIDFRNFMEVFVAIYLVPIVETDLWRVTRYTQGVGGALYVFTDMLPHAFGYGLTVLGVTALGYGWIKKRSDWLLFLIVITLQLVSISILTQKFTRHLIFIMGPFALIAARFLLVEMREKMRVRWNQRTADILVGAIAAVVLLISMAQTIIVSHYQDEQGIAERTSEYFREHIPGASIIAVVDHPAINMIPPLDSRHWPDNTPRYPVIDEIGYDIDSLRNSPAMYLADPRFFLRGLHNKYLNSDEFPKQRAFFEYLEHSGEWQRVVTFENNLEPFAWLFPWERLPLDMHRVNLIVDIYKRTGPAPLTMEEYKAKKEAEEAENDD